MSVIYTKKLDTANLRMLMRFDPHRIQAKEVTPEAIDLCRKLGVELLLTFGNNVAHIKKLDTENLQMLMRFDPFRIRARQATPEAIQACRMLGVELLLVPSEEPKLNKDEDAPACCRECNRARTRRILGAKVFIGQSDLSGFRQDLLSEDAENVVGNAGIKIRLKLDGQDRIVRDGCPTFKTPTGKPLNAILDEYAFFRIPDGAIYAPAETECTKNHLADVDFWASSECSMTDHGHVFEQTAKALKKAGYITGQTYEQCLEMAKWHPCMAEFLTKKLPGKVGSDTQKQQFGYAQTYLTDSGLII